MEGEYSLTNLGDLTAPDVHLIEEGEPCDRLNHAQGAYLPDGLYTEDGLYRYKLVEDTSSPYGWVVAKRSEEEIDADRAALLEPTPTPQERTDARLTALEEGKADKEAVAAVWDSMAAAYAEGVREA